eukprot:764403-Hanusia_phi.AAC.2
MLVGRLTSTRPRTTTEEERGDGAGEGGRTKTTERLLDSLFSAGQPLEHHNRRAQHLPQLLLCHFPEAIDELGVPTSLAGGSDLILAG